MNWRHVVAACAFGFLLGTNACPDQPVLPLAPSSITTTPGMTEEIGRISISTAREGVIVGAGDIANCDTRGAEQTAKLLDGIPGTVVTAGDNVYFYGSTLDYQRCYEPTWGRHKARTRPSPGNHEYETAGGSAYFDYFGENAGPPGLGYYAFSTAGWLILSLNTNVDVSELSPQMAWIKQTLRANSTRCAMAVFHHPPVGSGEHGGSDVVMDIWRTLVSAGVDVVMSGHEHMYERFSPLDASLRPSSNGTRLFVVGTGGTHLSPVFRASPGSQALITAWGC
jgi:hypothetical protein